MVTATVLDPVEPLPVREPVARRKGPAGAWQVFHRGKWVSENAVAVAKALPLHSDLERVAVALGITEDQARTRYDTYRLNFPDAPKASVRPRRAAKPKPTTDIPEAPVPPSPEPVTVPDEPQAPPPEARQDTPPQVTVDVMAAHEMGPRVPDVPDQVGRALYAQGWIECLLVVASKSDDQLVASLAKRGIELLDSLRDGPR